MFAAVRPPAEAVEHLEAFLEPRRAAADFRWTDPEQVHLTLAFYADVAEPDLDALLAGLADAAARRRGFSSSIRGGGAFPDVARGRVLWAGLELDETAASELDRLAVGCRNAGVAAGTEVDGQRFRPHLTLARCGRPTELTRWVRLLDSYAGPTWPVREVAVMISHLGEGRRRRPRYEQIADVMLA
ncbi:RNA 2',3'-cyclic phosphodiesterase [Nocardioides mangrovicus]|nr:RNA 2',3'-cyclic phosphodiesterase [Nocardioides mangrovicus]